MRRSPGPGGSILGGGRRRRAVSRRWRRSKIWKMPAMHPICLSSSGASSPNPPPPPPPPSTLAGGISSSDSDSSPITSSRTSNCRAAQLRKPRSKQRYVHYHFLWDAWDEMWYGVSMACECHAGCREERERGGWNKREGWGIGGVWVKACRWSMSSSRHPRPNAAAALPATRAGHACEGGLRSLLRGWACDRARTTTSPYHGHNTILSNPLPQRGYMVSIRFLLTGLDYVLAAAFVSPTFWIAKRRFCCMKVALILISD